jgi:hypothetical protein
VRVSSARARGVCASIVAVAVGLTCSLPQAAAAQSRSSTTPPTVAVRSLTTLSPSSLALLRRSGQGAQTPATGSSSFFKTPKGAAVLTLLGAGFGYALYSKFHDEIKSPIREQ